MSERRPYSAIAGLGFSRMSREDIGTARDLALEAVIGAVEDAGLALGDLDGLLLCRSPSAPLSDLPLRLRKDLALGDLRLLESVQLEGASSVGAIQHASLAIRHGLARAVACVFSDAPLKPGRSSGSAAYNRVMPLSGIEDWEGRYGLFGAAGPYALAASRYLAQFGLAERHLGAYVVAGRRWAGKNPLAFQRKPLSMDDYLSSRPVVDPFRVLDCAYPVNGAIAVVLTGCEAARDCRRPPVFVHAFGQGHAAERNFRGGLPEIRGGGAIAAKTLWAAVGIGPRDVQMCQIYDAFSYVGLQALEDYGLCGPGEAAEFVAEGHTSPGGRLPVNTGGGHLSGYYLQGMTPVSEAVIQARGDGGERQVARNDLILVTGSGGRLDYNAALLVGPNERL